MRRYPAILRVALAVTFLAIMLPGRAADLRLCLGADGHVAVSGSTADLPANACHTPEEDVHGPCVDLVLSSADLHPARSDTALSAELMTLSGQPLPWLTPVASGPPVSPIPPDARPAAPLTQLRTIVLRR